MMKLYIWKICFALILQLCSSHKETPFQGNNSLFSQDQLSRLFPLGNHNRINSKEVGAILTADREFIKDGGDVKIKAELVGIEAFENDYFAIQCGSVINDNDILDVVGAHLINSFEAEVHFYELTYLR